MLLLGKMASKIVGVYPMTRAFGSPRQEGIYTTLMMALFGLTHHIISDAQYSYLIAAVVASAVVPTLVANAFFLPRHLLPPPTSAREVRPPEVAAIVVKGEPE